VETRGARSPSLLLESNMILVILAIISAALFYLGSRARITQALWSLYPPRFAIFMDCAACTGFWWGLILSMLCIPRELMFDTLYIPRDTSYMTVTTPILYGFVMMVLTPIVAAIMQRALVELGSAVSAEWEATQPPPETDE
jgi:hypothetical protein